ncbi:glutathione S-transferase family protein [Ketogulonicigenium vulgare]|uniref:Glutathione S-transferase family protein n=1 Tax=Ketogulonicigenium vulgare (strain WSH-001) TaxID=759362 RepID=F9YA89_KETVW|nr:glutathione S-transferase family protein [Ketogulonicigenium vulgare]ADO42043.1 probable glutathione S-transferase family protein [Ketogulonicigenium vulgare Y25]AEM40262.1 glutathione S-transferase family protein [Ketogulonicigenium vulgare WSH-001]ALJ80462.1 glutathione S-transferase [Ketogulonicigenium vulgare]ANW33290.1 glutathione S-transferase [Ketogulonicigenium vulgare]AOZ53969.1 glutathione S-transferase family protein [Ketogulonicigenium vulgare]
MSEPVLYGHPDSGHACKVALALELAGVPHQRIWVDIWAAPETRPAAFLAGSPFAEVPLLVIDQQPYVQSGAILLEIAQRYQVLGGDSHAGLRRARELIVWEANRIGMCLPQIHYAAKVQNQGFPPGALDWLRARYQVDRANFDRLLGDAAFFHGDAPGVGDCAIWGYTQWINRMGVEPTTSMLRWIDNMRALPGMKTPESFFPN